MGCFQKKFYPKKQCDFFQAPTPAVAWIRSTFANNPQSKNWKNSLIERLHRKGKRVTSDGKYAITISDYRDGWLTVSLLIPSVSFSQWVSNYKQWVCFHKQWVCFHQRVCNDKEYAVTFCLNLQVSIVWHQKQRAWNHSEDVVEKEWVCDHKENAFSNLFSSRYGNYTCEATNDHGEVWHNLV